MDRARHRPIDPPVGRAFVGFATVEDGGQCVALAVVGPLVDNRLTLAVAFVDQSRPRIEEGRAEAIECDVAYIFISSP